MQIRERLEISQRITAQDLAQALEGQEGTFFCQQGGQGYIAVSKSGHSLVSLRPVGRRVMEVSAVITSGQEPWVIEKLSDNQDIFQDRGGYQQSDRGQGANR